MPDRHWIELRARWIAQAILIGLSIANVVWAVSDWRFHDLITYLDAAENWVEVGNPYAPTPRFEDWMIYRYAPWFAAIFVPLLSVPRPIVEVGFSIVVIAASALAVLPLIRQYGRQAVPLGLFLGTMLLGIGTGGNIQAVMVALLAWGLATRFGPVCIAIAASLKVAPLLFVLVYIGQRDWRKAGLTIALTGLLLGPILFFELPPEATMPGPSNSLIHVHPGLWLSVAVIAITFAAWQCWRVTKTRWLAVCAAAILASPRLIGYDFTILLAATPHGTAEEAEERTSRAAHRIDDATASEPALQS